MIGISLSGYFFDIIKYVFSFKKKKKRKKKEQKEKREKEKHFIGMWKEFAETLTESRPFIINFWVSRPLKPN